MMTENTTLYIIAAAALVALLVIIPVIYCARSRAKARKARRERQYREAERFTKQIIDQQIEYVNALHSIDDAAIRAFEAMMDDLMNKRNRPRFM